MNETEQGRRFHPRNPPFGLRARELAAGVFSTTAARVTASKYLVVITRIVHRGPPDEHIV
jgi:hypothetical protein